jgi:hypothetical protein
MSDDGWGTADVDGDGDGDNDDDSWGSPHGDQSGWSPADATCPTQPPEVTSPSPLVPPSATRFVLPGRRNPTDLFTVIDFHDLVQALHDSQRVLVNKLSTELSELLFCEFPASVAESLLAANEWKMGKLTRTVSESTSEDVLGEVLATCGRLKSEVLAQATTVPPLACAPDGFVVCLACECAPRGRV